MSAITIRLDWPYEELWPNYRNRKNFHGIAAAKRQYRQDSRYLAQVAKDCKTDYPLTGPLTAHATFYITKGRGPDVDNALASLKAGIDGVADAGVIANDRDIALWSAEVVKGMKREVVLTLKERPL